MVDVYVTAHTKRCEYLRNRWLRTVSDGKPFAAVRRWFWWLIVELTPHRCETRRVTD